MRIRRYWIACFLLVSATAVGHADGLMCGPWTRFGAEPPFGGASLNAVTYGDGVFVAVGDGGLIVTSPDGFAWTRRESGETADLRGVAWSGARYVAVGDGGMILVSDNAVSWRRVEVNGLPHLRAVTWSGTHFIAVGDGATVVVSEDDEVWETASVAGGDDVLLSVACGGGQCVAGGGYTESAHFWGVIYRSTDGLTWNGSALSLHARDVVWTGDRFVAAGFIGEGLNVGAIGSSEDGLEWAVQDSGVSSTEYSSVARSDSEIIAFGNFGRLLVSADGLEWSERKSSLGSWVRDAAWGDGRWVAVGWQGQTAVSEDGVWWAVAVPRLSDFFYHWRGAASNGSVVVAAGSDTVTETPFVYRTADGATWQRVALGEPFDMGPLSTFGERFVGVTRAGFATSPDGVTWTHAPVPSAPAGGGLACSPSRCVAVGSVIMTSDDALTWRSTGLPQGYQPWDVAWDGTRFVVVGRHGWRGTGALFMRSDDGEHWETSEQPGYPTMPTAVAAGGGMLAVIGGQRGHVFTGTDGFAWQDHDLSQQAEMRDVVWTGSYFAVLGRKPDGIRSGVWMSRDGAAWSEVAVPGSYDLREIAGSGPRLYLFGDQGTILSTSCGDSVGARAPRRRLPASR